MDSGTPTGGEKGAEINGDITTVGGGTGTGGMVSIRLEVVGDLITKRETSKKASNRCSIGDHGSWVVGREGRRWILPLNQENI